eukprot:997607-Pleurochrysis_carterae.AAC.1
MTRFTDGAQAPAANGRPPAANGSRPPLRYRLTATLMHVGNSAHSGHYQARVHPRVPGYNAERLSVLGYNAEKLSKAGTMLGGPGAAHGKTAREA